MDQALVPEESMEMRAHADACPACAELAGALREALAICHGMGNEVAVPETAATAWRRAVRAEKNTGAKARHTFAMPRWEAWAGLAAGILVLIGGTNLVRFGRMNINHVAVEQAAPAVDHATPVEATLEPQADALHVMEMDAPSDTVISDMAKVLFSAPSGAMSSGGGDGEAFFEAEIPAPLAFYEDADTSEAPALHREQALGMEPSAARYWAEEAPEEIMNGMMDPKMDEDAAPDVEVDAEADARARSAPLAFLLDAGIFAALCLPPAAIAYCIARLRRRGKKMQKQPKP